MAEELIYNNYFKLKPEKLEFTTFGPIKHNKKIIPTKKFFKHFGISTLVLASLYSSSHIFDLNLDNNNNSNKTKRVIYTSSVRDALNSLSNKDLTDLNLTEHKKKANILYVDLEKKKELKYAKVNKENSLKSEEKPKVIEEIKKFNKNLNYVTIEVFADLNRDNNLEKYLLKVVDYSNKYGERYYFNENKIQLNKNLTTKLENELIKPIKLFYSNKKDLEQYMKNYSSLEKDELLTSSSYLKIFSNKYKTNDEMNKEFKKIANFLSF